MAATLREYYNTGDNTNFGDFYGSIWFGQTFTVGIVGANENHNITSVKVKTYRSGSPGTCYAHIYAVDVDGKPTGSPLSSGSVNANDWATYPGAWHTINMSSYTLLASTQYALVLRASNGNASNYLVWRADSSSPSYTGGVNTYSTNGGSSWTLGSLDTMFEIWGETGGGGVVIPAMVHHYKQAGGM